MNKIGKTIAAITLALTAALCLGANISALDYSWKDEVLEFAEYCETHTYKERISYFMSELGDGDGSYLFLKEKDLQTVQSGENALIVVKYKLEEDLDPNAPLPPQKCIYFHAYMSDGAKSTYDPFGKDSDCKHVLTERNAFTVKEHLLEMGVDDPKELLLLGINFAEPSVNGIDVLGYDLLPCKNGWNEIDGARYYVKKDGTLATSSLIIGGIRYQFGKDGVCQGEYTGFTKSDKGKRYWKDGKLLKNERFKAKNGRRYYADKNGYLTEILTLAPFRTGDDCEVLGEQRIEFGEAVSQSRAVVRAKCVGLTWQFNSDRDYLFLLNETLSGEDISDSFTLRVRVDDIDVDDPSSQRTYYRYTGEDILFREDTEYLLLLTECARFPDTYLPTADAVIPLGEDGVFENAAIQGRPLDELDRIEQVKDYLPVIPKTIAFQKPDPDKLDEIDEMKVDFDEAVSMSFTLVRAKCMGLIEQTSEKRVYCFTRKELLGRMSGELPYIFYVTVSEGDHGVEDAPGYTSADIHYKENTDYLLPLRKSMSVFYENDKYYSVGNTVIELKKNGAFKNPTIQGRRIEGITKLSRLWDYLVDRELFCGQPSDEIGTKFTRSDDLGEVVNSSDYVLEVTISDYFYNLAEDRTTYTCTVNEILKAKNTKITNVYAALPKDGAQIGGRYLLLLNRVSDESYVYTVSSLTHSVHPADSPTADEIRTILKEKR